MDFLFSFKLLQPRSIFVFISVYVCTHSVFALPAPFSSLVDTRHLTLTDPIKGGQWVLSAAPCQSSPVLFCQPRVPQCFLPMQVFFTNNEVTFIPNKHLSASLFSRLGKKRLSPRPFSLCNMRYILNWYKLII